MVFGIHCRCATGTRLQTEFWRPRRRATFCTLLRPAFFPKSFSRRRKEQVNSESGRLARCSAPALIMTAIDGRQTWFDIHKEHLTPKRIAELDDFMSPSFQLPEFENLKTMTRFCRNCAEPTSESTEFNLYGQSQYFHIRLRLITRFRDYNVHAHFHMRTSFHESGRSRKSVSC